MHILYIKVLSAAAFIRIFYIISEIVGIVQSARRFPLREFTIIFRSVPEIASFVNTVNRYPFHARILCGTAQLDAKSLLSLSSLSLNTPISLRIDDYIPDPDAFAADIAPFLAVSATA